MAAPQPSGPPSGAANPELPPFVWRPSRGAESYEFQIAADRGFNSSVRGLRNNRFDTANTRATITTAVPNGTYWWRVRAVTKTGQVSAWSTPRSCARRGQPLPLRGPVNGARVSFRSAADPLLGAGAARGEVPRLARHRPGSGHADRGQDGRDVGDELRPVADPVGRQGQDLLLGRDPARRAGQPRHAVAHRLLRLGVASQTATKLTDARAEPETFDPEFSWQPVAGAARYELEVSYSRDFAPARRCAATHR